jgi:branched-chain amino acid transport system ATP-binding protein
MTVHTNGHARPPLLELDQVTAGYGQVTVLREVNLYVEASSVVAVLGPNGAGKTTLLRTATGLVTPKQGRVLLQGDDITSHPPYTLARRGFCLIPEGRGIFPSLTVRENLILSCQKSKDQRPTAIAKTIEILPVLGSRLHQVAGSLSGGEQQMLALARAMVNDATLVAVDEASLGLAPSIVERVYDVLQEIVASGAAVLLVEQYVNRAIDFADRVYMLNKGEIVFSGSADEVKRDELFAQYLGSPAT